MVAGGRRRRSGSNRIGPRCRRRRDQWRGLQCGIRHAFYMRVSERWLRGGVRRGGLPMIQKHCRPGTRRCARRWSGASRRRRCCRRSLRTRVAWRTRLDAGGRCSARARSLQTSPCRCNRRPSACSRGAHPAHERHQTSPRRLIRQDLNAVEDGRITSERAHQCVAADPRTPRRRSVLVMSLGRPKKASGPPRIARPGRCPPRNDSAARCRATGSTASTSRRVRSSSENCRIIGEAADMTTPVRAREYALRVS